MASRRPVKPRGKAKTTASRKVSQQGLVVFEALKPPKMDKHTNAQANKSKHTNERTNEQTNKQTKRYEVPVEYPVVQNSIGRNVEDPCDAPHPRGSQHLGLVRHV